MPKPRQFFEAMAEDLFHFNIVLIPFAFLLAAVSGGIKAPLMMLVFLPVLPYHYAVRTFVPKFTPFLVLTWVICPLGLLTGHYILKTLFLGILCSHAVRRRTNEGTKLRITFETLAFPLIFLAVIYAAADYLGMPQMRIFFHLQAVIIFLLTIVYAHLRGINAELELASANSLQSTKEITGFANKYLAVYLIGFFAVLMLFRFVPFGDAAAALGRLITRVIRFFAQFIKTGGYIKMGIPIDGMNEQDIPFEAEIPPAPLWLRIIESVTVYIVNIAVLLLFVISIAVIFLRLYYGFYRRKDIKITYLNGTSEITAITPQKKKKRERYISDPIRRKFYKKVKKYVKRNIVTSADTPLEIRDKLSNRENLDDLAVKYEEVRYQHPFSGS